MYQNWKHIKNFKRIISGGIWVVIGFYALLFTLTHIPQVQRFIGSKVAGELSEKLGTEVSVGRVDLGFFNRIIIDDILILDQRQKEMLKASRVSAKIELLPLLDGRVSISAAQLFGARLQLYRDSAGADMNMQFVLDSLASRDTTTHSPLDLRINSLIIRHSNVSYDQLDATQTEGLLNPQHLNLSDISADLVLKALKEDSLNLNIKKLSFREQSGLQVKRLTMHVEASGKQATLKDFLLQLPHSSLTLGDLTARYQFRDKRLVPGSFFYQGTVEESDITLADISCLLPKIQTVTNSLKIVSSFSGTDSSIDIPNLQASSADNTIEVHANGFIHHWDENPAWQIQSDRIRLSEGSTALLKDVIANQQVADIISRLGNITVTGQADGTGRSINSEVHLLSDAGNIEADFNMNQQQQFTAHVESSSLQLNRLLARDDFGEVKMNLDIEGQNSDKGLSSITLEGNVPLLVYRGYQYNDIGLSVNYSPQEISGSIDINDPNIQLTADGTVTRRGNTSDVQLQAKLANFSPTTLNLAQGWNGVTFNANIDADFSASSLNDAVGSIGISQFSMLSENSNYNLKHLNIVSGYDEMKQHFVSMKSDFAIMHIKGSFDYAALPQSLANLMGRYLPTLPGLPAQKPTDNNFAFQLNVFRSDWLNLLGVPLTLDDPLLVSGFINDRQQTVSMMGGCTGFTYKDGRYSDAALHVGTVNDTLRCAVDVVKHMDNGQDYSLSLRSGAADNKINASLSWDNHDEQRMSGTLNTASRFFLSPDGHQTSVISVLPSQIVLRNTDWKIEPAEIVYAKNALSVNHFVVKHGQQHIIIDGKASDNPADQLTADIVDVDVEYILDIVNFHSVNFSGLASGKAYASNIFDDLQANAELTVQQFQFEHGRMGTLHANAKWDNTKKIIDINAISNDGPDALTFINGYVDPSRPGYIDLDIKAVGTHIDFAQSFTSSFADRVEGQGQGAVRLYGPLNNINLTGLLVIDGEVDVRQLNTTYALRSDTVNFIPDDIRLQHCAIYDKEGHKATVDGYLHHQHLTRMTFDLGIEAENLLGYDFKDFGSEIFYGTVYGTGSVFIQGRPGRVTFDIDVTPEKNSIFVYNASTPDAITNQEFITWESASATRTKENAIAPAPQPSSNIYLNFTIRCTPDATVRLLMDAKTNDYVTINGTGTLQASYYNKGGLQMFGTYVVNKGTYNMTIQEIIKKDFIFQNGGTIVFGGNPFDAQLNLQASYMVNGVSLSDLNVGRSFSNNTVRINCLMNIGGQAGAPQVDFDLAMPTVSADEQQMIRSVINGQQEMNQQVLYLLGIGRFYPQTGNNATAEGQTQQSQTSLAMQSLLSGTISSQINELLKNVVNNSNWNFGANISTGDEGWNNAEYEGIISGRLLNNRLLINGQFGYRDRTTTATPSFIGDFDVQYLLTPSGSLAIKMYNQTNDRYFTRSSLNTQGLGFILKKDFSSFSDFLGIKRQKKAEVPDSLETGNAEP